MQPKAEAGGTGALCKALGKLMLRGKTHDESHGYKAILFYYITSPLVKNHDELHGYKAVIGINVENIVKDHGRKIHLY